MNSKQRIAVFAGLLINAAMAAYPPWRYTLDFSAPPSSHSVAGTHAEHFAGYSPVVSPPSMEASHLCEVFGLDCKNRFFGNPAYYSVSIDLRMLSVQVFLVPFLVGAVAIAFGRKPRASNDSERSSSGPEGEGEWFSIVSDGPQFRSEREQGSDEVRKSLNQFSAQEKKRIAEGVKELLNDPKEKAANEVWLKMQEEKLKCDEQSQEQIADCNRRFEGLIYQRIQLLKARHNGGASMTGDDKVQSD